MVRPLEDLALLGNRGDHGFERGSAIGVAKCPSLDLVDHRTNATPDGAEILEALGPEKPRLESSVSVRLPSLNGMFFERLVLNQEIPESGPSPSANC